MWIALEQQQQRMLVVELLAVFCSVALEVVAKVLRESVLASLKLEQMVFELLRSVLQEQSLGASRRLQPPPVAFVGLNVVTSLVLSVSWIYYQSHLSRDPQRPPALEKPTVGCEPLKIGRMLQVMGLLPLPQQVRVQQVEMLHW
eukprot:s1762_g10.t1